MGREILAVLEQFGAGGSGDPGDNAVRFLLAAFFWAVLAAVARQHYRRLARKRDFYIFLAALAGLARELLMFFFEYGTFRGWFPSLLSYRVFPPLEHLCTGVGRVLLGFAYLRYFLVSPVPSRLFLQAGLTAFVVLYGATQPLWIGFLENNPGMYREIGVHFALFWGDMAFRVTASLFMAAVILLLARESLKGRKVSLALYLGFGFLFLDEFLMIINISTGFLARKDIYAPIRHNLAIWAVPFFVWTYWQELFRSIADEKAKAEGVLDAIGDGVAIENTDHRIIYQNPAHRELAGDQTGQDCTSVFKGEDRVCTLAGGELKGMVLARTTRDSGGQEHQVEISSSRLSDSEGNTAGFVSLMRDVTQRHLAAEALRVSEERYRSLVENISLGITLIDRDYRVVMTNAAQGNLLGRDPGTFVGRHCFREFERRDDVCDHCPGTRAMRTGEVASAEAEGVRDDGSRLTVRIHAFPVREGGSMPSGFIEVVEDISEEKNLLGELRRVNEQLLLQNKELQKLDRMKDALISDVSHELKTPVAKHAMYLEVIKAFFREHGLAEGMGEILDVMEAGLRRQQGVIGNILLMSSLEAGSRPTRSASVDLGKVAAQVLNEYQHIAGAVGLELDLDAEEVTVATDAEMLWHVFSNIVDNAVKYRAEEDPRLLVSVVKKDDRVVVTFADNGIGMDEDLIENAFERFHQASAASEGIGLGLNISKLVIEKLGGTVSLSSDGPGRGATATVTLPL